MKKATITIFAFFLLVSLTQAQIHVRHYTTRDGLPHDFTFNTFQDDLGYLWIGTDDGLVKFNGNDFKVFDRTHGFRTNYIIDIKTYAQDTLVIASWGGGLHFIENDRVFKFDIEKDTMSKSNKLVVLGKDIVGAGEGEYLLYNRTNKHTFSRKKLEVFQKKDRLILSDSGQLKNRRYSRSTKVNNDMYFYRGVYSPGSELLKGIHKYTPPNSIELVFPFFKDMYINAFGAYNDSTFYASVEDRFYVFNQTGILQEIKHNFGGNTIHGFVRTRYCEVYAVRNSESGDDLVYVYDLKKDHWFDLSTKIQGEALISSLYVDATDNIWVATDANGLYKISEYKSMIDEVLFDTDHILDIAVSNTGAVFFLSLNKIYGYDTNSKKITIKNLGYQTIKFGKNKINDTLLRPMSFKIKKNEHEALSFLGHQIVGSTKVEKELDDATVIYDVNCVKYFKDDKPAKKTCVRDLYKDAVVHDVEKVNEELWVAANLGIFIFDLAHLGLQRMINLENGLQNIHVKQILSDSERGVWVVTNEGLSLVEKDNKVVNFHEENGLGSSRVNHIFLDHRGVLWIGTQKGFTIYNGQMFYNFNEKDGLPSSFVSRIQEDKDHHIWISGNKGVVRIDNTMAFKPLAPLTLLVNKKESNFTLDVIDYSEKDITMQYKTNKTHNWKLLNSKILETDIYDKGAYDFKFRARNPNSDWVYSEDFPMVIKEVWYKRSWIIVFAIMILASSVIFLIGLQLRRVSNRNKLLHDTIKRSTKLQKELSTVRENVAQDFHDELGNKLAGITVMSEIMMKDKELRQTKSIGMIEQVRKDGMDLYSGIKDFVWSIDSKSDHLVEFIIYLTDFGEELFQNKGIAFRVESKGVDEDIRLPHYWSRHLLLLFKEVMTNALRHAEATEVILFISYEKDVLTIEVTDNGKGFEIGSLKRKSGLLNMENRAIKIGGELSIIALNGTMVTFRGHIS